MTTLVLLQAPTGKRVSWRFLEPIWHIHGRIPLAPGQAREEAFARLSPLFQTYGTTHHQVGDTLTFTKKDPAAQDKLAVFSQGVLQIRESAAGATLHYRLASRPLLYCFLAPLLFLAFAGLTIGAGKLDPPQEPTAAEKAKEEAKAAKPLPQHWIDTMLGAPVPERPGADKAKKDAAKDKKGDTSKKEEKEDKEHSPTPAYVFAGIFAVLYLVGRVLEDRLVKRLFRRKLLGA
jgi:hypothetical protein